MEECVNNNKNRLLSQEFDQFTLLIDTRSKEFSILPHEKSEVFRPLRQAEQKRCIHSIKELHP
jgi:hypothetical protein